MSILILWSKSKYTAEEGEVRKWSMVLEYAFYLFCDPECIFVVTFFNSFFIFLMLGLPWIANYQCCRSQPAGYNPELVQERVEAMQWTPTYCGSLQVFGWVVVFFMLFDVSISSWESTKLFFFISLYCCIFWGGFVFCRVLWSYLKQRENDVVLPDSVFMSDCKPGFCLLPRICHYNLSFSPT